MVVIRYFPNYHIIKIQNKVVFLFAMHIDAFANIKLILANIYVIIVKSCVHIKFFAWPKKKRRSPRRLIMYISYNKLWKLLIDKDMNKQHLKRVSGVSSASIAKLGKGENITTDVLVKICKALDCDIVDIMELVQEDK